MPQVPESQEKPQFKIGDVVSVDGEGYAIIEGHYHHVLNGRLVYRTTIGDKYASEVTADEDDNQKFARDYLRR